MVVDVKNALDNLLSACRSVQPILLAIGEKRDIEGMTVREILNFYQIHFDSRDRRQNCAFQGDIYSPGFAFYRADF